MLSVSVLAPQRKALRLARRRGITLIEAALVLSLTGVLVAAFLPTFLRQVHTSKLAEATELLDALHRSAALYYETAHAGSTGLVRGCLPDSAGPYPLAPSPTPVSVDFLSDDAGAPTWRALGQSQPRLLRYSYQVTVPEAGCSARLTRPTITFQAQGDLDGDGSFSLLERTSVVEQQQLVPQGPLRIVGRVE